MGEKLSFRNSNNEMHIIFHIIIMKIGLVEFERSWVNDPGLERDLGWVQESAVVVNCSHGSM